MIKYVFIALLVLSSCSEGGYCKGDDYQSTAEMLDLVPFAMCGNLYRFDSEKVEIQIQTEDELKKNPDYQPYFNESIVSAIENWNNILKTNLIPVYHESEFQLFIGYLPQSDKKYLAGKTFFNVEENRESEIDLRSYVDLALKSEYWIESIKIIVNPIIPENWSRVGEITPERIEKVATHELGHMLGIYGHSDDKNDIMAQDSDGVELSFRDIKTIQYVYSRSYDLKIEN